MLLLLLLVVVCAGGLNASFDPLRFGFRAIDAKTYLFDYNGFNPSVAKSPLQIACYVAVFRHRGSLCSRLSSRRLTMQSSVVLLDSEMRVVAPVMDHGSRRWDFGREDVRFEAGGLAVGNRLLTSSMMYKHHTKHGRAEAVARWEVRWLELNVSSGGGGVVTASLGGVRHPDIQGFSGLYDGKNMGILWDGTDAQPFRVVHWLREMSDVRRGIPGRRARAEGGKPLVGLGGRHLKMNGSPLPLDEVCDPGYLLAIAHVHTDEAAPAHVPEFRKGTTRYGNTYAHYLVVLEARAPYRRRALSPPFCFPSTTHAPDRWCDTIQFVSGFIRLNSTTILATFGVNDCLAAYAYLDLKVLLDFVNQTFAHAHCGGHER